MDISIKNSHFLARLPFVLILLITLVFAKLQYNKHLSSEEDICFNICSDGRGYYAWLPAIFIHQDLNFHFFDEIEVKGETCGGVPGGCLQEYRYDFGGKTCNKYYPGASFMMLPFFATAHLSTILFTQDDANGYSPLYFKIIGFSGIFYYALGMYVFLCILKRFFLSIWQECVLIIVLTFGTNMMYYAVDKPTFSHVYSFVLIGIFVLYSFKLKERFDAQNLASLCFITGFIFVTRPVNLTIVLLLPFLFAGQISEHVNQIIKSPKLLVCVSLVFIMPLALLTLYKLSTNRFWVYSYSNEGFDFLRPHYFDFLFHYDNGLFLYMPILIVPFLTICFWINEQNRLVVIGIVVTLIVTVYIHSSWWCWSYSFSFGARTMLDFMVLFGLLFAFMMKQKINYSVLLLCILCLAITMLLYHQKHNGFMNVYPITDYWKALENGIGL